MARSTRSVAGESGMTYRKYTRAMYGSVDRFTAPWRTTSPFVRPPRPVALLIAAPLNISTSKYS